MRTNIGIWLLVVGVVLAWTGMAGAQTAISWPRVQLPSGEAVWDLNGDWDALIENYGPQASGGTHPNVYRITQTGSAFSAIRLRDNPPPTQGRAGTPSLQGELEEDGFKRVEIVKGIGEVSPSTGHINEDGKKIVIDNGRDARVTLTRP
jgi:hypothetical protein